MVNERRHVEDIYPLTPMQQGMLFHALYAADTGVYVQQVSARLSGAFDVELMRRSWQTLVDRHPVLRTGFEWERRADPFQVVYRQATLPWTELDWSHEPAAMQATRLEQLLAADRARGFALRSAPLMRVTIARLGPASCQLVWSHHHLILDGWSVPLLLHDLFTAYEAHAGGRTPALEPRRPFRDHVAWLKTRDRADAERFWTGELRGVEAAPALPARTAARRGRTFAGAPAHAVRRLAADETERLTAFARSRHLTLSTVLQGAWALVLSRYSGVPRALYGVTVSGRPADVAGADTMIGLFINTLPVHVELPPAMPAAAWLTALQERIARQRAFEQTPLVDVLGWSGLGRDTTPLETLFVFENYPVDAALDTRLPQLRIEQADAHEQTNFPITFVAAPGAELLLKIDYDSGRYDADVVERLLDGVTRTLAALPRDADRPLGAFDILAPEEHARIATQAAGPVALRGAPFVHELIDAQAAETPDAAAIVEDGAAMPFRTLLARSDAVAAALRARGIGGAGEHRVGVELPSSADLVVALLGVLKAGAAYVPIDASHPAERRRFVADDSGVRVVIDRALLAVLEGEQRAPAPPVSMRGDTLAYVLYTSGSTGTPKGVMVTHDGLANYVRWAIDAYGAAAGAGAPLHSPLGFDLTVTSIYPLLAAGRPVHIVAPGERLDGLVRALSGSPGHSLVKITPAHLDALRDLLPAGEARGAARAFVIGGEALTHEQLRHWRAHAPDTRLFNEYGPTETVVGCAIYDAAADTHADGAVPIGVPAANTRLYVLDQALCPAPTGVAGELYIAGAGVARGYQGRPDLTAERFLPDPFARGGARMYRSGDLVRRRADGLLEFLGRGDSQVKIRGYRIEPGEIEAALAAHPSVAAASVVVVSRPSGDAQLAAFVTPATASTSLREHLRRRLPDYMVPATVLPIDALPLTPNGKVDRQALAALAQPAGATTRRFAPPRGVVEEMLAALWADVLGAGRIGRDDNFFDLGGHSLVATRLAARIRQAFGVTLPLKAIFEAPTIARLAVQLTGGPEGPPLRSNVDTQIEDAAPIQPRPAGEPPVLSLAQRRLWFLNELDPDSPAYLVPAGLAIDGALDTEALAWALRQVVARHEVLRTRIETVDGAPRVTIVDDAAMELPVSDVQEDQVARLAAAEASTPLPMARPPLLRARLLRISGTRHVLLITLHHIACDAWSMDILVTEIATLYDAGRSGRPSPLPPLALQYADVARAEQPGAGEPASLDYWRTRLQDVPPLALPHDFPRPVTPSSAGASISIDLPAAAAVLAGAGRADGITPFMAFLAVFELLLARYAGATDFAVGTPVANRPRAELAGLIGFFMNTLALRSDVREHQTFAQLVRRIRATTLDAAAHAGIPFEQLVERLQPARELGHHPIFQVMFTLQHATNAITLPGLRLTPLPSAAVASKFDLSLAITESAEGWRATFEYSTALFSAATIARMARHYARLVTAAAAAPERGVFTLDWLDDDDRRDAISRGAPVAGTAMPVHECVAAQASRTPEAAAVIDAGETVTYRELARRATALAERLVGAGVRPGDRVALALDRSIELVVSMLAVLEAGAAYVPIDPAAPRPRIEAMVADAGAAVVIDEPWLRANEQEHGNASVLSVNSVAPVSSVNSVASSPWPRRATPLPPFAGPEVLAYILFTSGSTGRPKGVMIPHRALANHMAWLQRVYPLATGDRVLQKTPAIFDASVWEFWAPLMAGATLVLAPPGAQQDPDALVAAITRHGITTLQVVPSLLRALLEIDAFGRCDSLRRVFAGGEALTRELQDRFFATSGAALINLYGPTEVTIDAVTWACDRRGAGARVPIGRPVDNTTAYVLDGMLEPVPGGIAGELYLGGPQVGLGYAAQPALTAERFLPDPFAAVPGARMYRTGDRARRLASGELDYLGRTDDQIKLRGVRVEPGEIERVLEQHAAVRQAVVDLRVAGPTRRLVAYVTTRDGAAWDEQALRAHARAQLVEQMVPAVFMRLEQLPMLPSGKVNRRRLPDPPRDAAADAVPPRNRRESLLAGVWAGVLGLPHVGIRDNFFTLGGDSILSLQVVARARAAGLTITPAQMFLHQTIEALAPVALEQTTDAGAGQPASGPLALTPIQRWFFDLDLPHRHHWNQAMLLETPAGAEAAHLDAALSDVVARHDVFRLQLDGAALSYAGRAALPLEIVNLRHGSDLASHLTPHLDRVQASIDLGRAPLARAALFTPGDDSGGRLLLAAHHLIIDGVSWRVLLEDLQTAYEARRAGRAPAFAAATASFQSWSRRLEREAATPETRSERRFWTMQLADAPRLRRDMDGGNLESDARHADIWLSEAHTDPLLREAPARHGARPIDLMLAALVETLAPRTDTRTLLVDLESHGRDVLDLDVSRTVGWFTTLYPVRFDASAADGPAALLALVVERLRAVPRKGLGYGLLRGSVPAVRPEVAFDYHGQWSGAAASSGFAAAPEPPGALRAPAGPRPHVLDVVAGVVDGRLQVRWTYSARQFRHDTIGRLAEGYRRSLQSLVDHCLHTERRGHAPSDFTAAGLDQRELDKLLSRLRGV